MQQLSGFLNLTCGCDEQNRTKIRRQYCSAPMHISKPYWDGQILIIQIINSTAGLFAGDSLQSKVNVETGARVLITTPSASRVHVCNGSVAEVQQAFHVSSGAWLEYSPALLIPQSQARYRQSTHIEVARDGELFSIEPVAPGRTARGERFQFQEIDWECNVTYDGKLALRERYKLRPDDDSLASLKKPFSDAYYASGFLISNRLNDKSGVWDQVRSLNSDRVLLGVSRLIIGGWSIKVLAKDSVNLRRTIQRLRATLSETVLELKSVPRIL